MIGDLISVAVPFLVGACVGDMLAWKRCLRLLDARVVAARQAPALRVVR